MTASNHSRRFSSTFTQVAAINDCYAPAALPPRAISGPAAHPATNATALTHTIAFSNFIPPPSLCSMTSFFPQHACPRNYISKTRFTKIALPVTSEQFRLHHVIT